MLFPGATILLRLYLCFVNLQNFKFSLYVVACSKIDIKKDKAYSNFLCILAISGQKVAKCKL